MLFNDVNNIIAAASNHGRLGKVLELRKYIQHQLFANIVISL